MNDPRPYTGLLSGFKGWQPHPDGRLNHGVMFVGESLGAEEVIASRPFVGAAGRLLDRLIARTKTPYGQLFREDFLIDNIVRAQPPDNNLNGPWYAEALEFFKPYISETLAKYKPRVIVPLGMHATRWFLPEICTKLKEIKKIRGYVYETPWGLVLPSYHPAYLLRGQMALSQVVQHDVSKALRVSKEGLKRPAQKYILSPSLPDFLEFERRHAEAGFPPLDSDIETPYSDSVDESDRLIEEYEDDDSSYTILRVSLSFKDGEVITAPWQAPFIEPIKRMYATPSVKRFWNGLSYDVPRIEHNGAPINGDIHDMMLFFRRLEPHLPYGLSYASTLFTDLEEWKSTSTSRPEYYSCVDSDALGKCAAGIEKELRKRGLWDKTLRNVVHLFRVLRKMTKRGIRVDSELRKKSWADFEERLDAAQAECQTFVPPAILKQKVYKNQPSAKAMEKGDWIQVPVEIDIPEGKFYDATSGRVKKVPKPTKERKTRRKKNEADSPEVG